MKRLSTPMTDAERDAYAVPGTLLRRLLDDDVVPWPTVEEAAYEKTIIGIIERGEITLADLEEWSREVVRSRG